MHFQAEATAVFWLDMNRGWCEPSAVRVQELLAGAMLILVVTALEACGQDVAPSRPSDAGAAEATPTAQAASQSERPRQYTTVKEALRAIRARVDVPVRLPSSLPGNLELALDPKFANGGAQLYLRGGKRNLIIEYGHAGFDGCGPTDPQRVDVGSHRGVMQVHRRGKRPYTTVVWPATLQRPVGTYGLSGDFSASETLRLARQMNTKRTWRKAPQRQGC